MRLIRDFYDYYDGLQASDQEEVPLYVRKKSEEHVEGGDKARLAELAAMIEPYAEFLPKPPHRTSIQRRIFGFCGRIQPLYLYAGSAFPNVYLVSEAVLNAPEPTGIYAQSERWSLKREQDLVREAREVKEATSWGGPTFSAKGWDHWLTNGAPRWKEPHDELFRDLGVPVFTAYYSRKGYFKIVKNPSLKDLGVQGLLQPFQVWQSIDQYLSNQMAQQIDPPSPGYTDELRRDAHGFDKKSFKNEAPSEKKARRKANRKRKREQNG